MMLSSSAASFLLLVLCAAVSVIPADGFASHDISVVCDDAVPEVCRGTRYMESPVQVFEEPYDPTDPNPSVIEVGKYNWEFTFVRGLPEGYFSGVWPVSYGIYEYGPTVDIEMDVAMENCTVTVGNETCASCELCAVGLWKNEELNATFTADCTNLNTADYDPDVGAGRMMECASTVPFFYPLEIPDGLPVLPTVAPPAADGQGTIQVEGEAISRGGGLRKTGNLFG